MPKSKAQKKWELADRVRVWWPPSDDADRTDFGGAYWPVSIIKVLKSGYRVRYDNGDDEDVPEEDIHPNDPPVEFGHEQIPLQAGEFVEVFNGSSSDPAAWLGRVVDIKEKATYLVTYPFHDESEPEEIKMDRLRRARLFEHETNSWKIIKPEQTWNDGEVASPSELFTITPRELAQYLSQGFRGNSEASSTPANGTAGKRKEPVQDHSKGASKEKVKVSRPSAENGAVNKRKGHPQRLR